MCTKSCVSNSKIKSAIVARLNPWNWYLVKKWVAFIDANLFIFFILYSSVNVIEKARRFCGFLSLVYLLSTGFLSLVYQLRVGYYLHI